MSVQRTTTRTIERGVRIASKSRSGSPCEHVKQQLHAFVDYSNCEKQELGKLNTKMSNYVSRVKMLENENNKLMGAISEIQAGWGEASRQVREQYEQNLFDMRGRIDDVAHLKTIADVRHKRAVYENGEYQKQLEDNYRVSDAHTNKIKNLERELIQLNDSHDNLKQAVAAEIKDIERFKASRDDTWAGLVELLDRLDDELFRRIGVEYNNQTLREHIEFVKQINERELNEMAQLSTALPFNEQIEFYKDQLKRVISNIRKDYEQLHMDQTREMEEWMKMKKEELSNMYNEKDPLHDMEMNMHLENIEQLRDAYDANIKEIEDLKRDQGLMAARLQQVEEQVDLGRAHVNETLDAQNVEVKRLNEELQALTNDYNHINVNKATLEYEINVYKRLLDSQLDRFGKQPIETVVVQQKPAAAETLVTNESFGGKVQNKKEKKGTVGVSDASPDGKFIQLENTGTSSAPVDISGWSIKRKVDNNAEVVYRFPSGTVIAAGKEITVWAKAYAQHHAANDLVTDFENWGIGITSLSRLVNGAGEEKSSFNQQITFGY
jgi:chromosome segregation ATPase